MWALFLALLIHTVFLVCGNEKERQQSSPTDKMLDNNNRVNCGNNYESECFIEATFGNLASTSESIDVLVNCTSASTSYRYNQFSQFNMVVWNGCYATRDLKYFGLRKIHQASRRQVRHLKIENFISSAIESGTFEGFVQLEVLSIQSNSIQNLSASCFSGLESLLELRLIANGLKWISAQVLSKLSKLNLLAIEDAELSMTDRQFGDDEEEEDSGRKIVGHVSMKIYHIGMDLVEHLFHHVRNLSISLTSSDDFIGMDYCELTRFNGYEKAWIVENLKLENHRCGFVMENVDSLRTLELKRVILRPISFALNDFKLKNLQNLTAIALNHNELTEISQSIFEGAFRSLETLDISFNRLSEIDMSIFKLSFPKLKRIDLRYNSIHRLSNVQGIEELHLLVDMNDFDCIWLMHALMWTSRSFNYTKSWNSLNVNGLDCSFHYPSSTTANPCGRILTTPNDYYYRKYIALEQENYVLRPNILLSIICGSILLTFIVTFASIYLYRRHRLLSKREPFYHMLRDSLIQPFAVARETVAREFKGVFFRNLPATNYEQPISDTCIRDMTRETDAGNIYEEIPADRAEQLTQFSPRQ
jgi:Leucine-rich repeat (LRR) protein